jgi:hypothetical protein
MPAPLEDTRSDKSDRLIIKGLFRSFLCCVIDFDTGKNGITIRLPV